MSPTVPDFCRRAPRPSFVCLVPHVSALTSDEQKYSLHIRDSDYSEETTPASSRDARSRATSPPIAGSSSPPDPRPIRVRREAASARNEGRWRHQGLRRRRWRRGADADAAAATRGAPLLLPLLPRRLLRLAPLHPGTRRRASARRVPICRCPVAPLLIRVGWLRCRIRRRRTCRCRGSGCWRRRCPRCPTASPARRRRP